MYFAYKYARKKYKERQQAKEAKPLELHSSEAGPSAQQEIVANHEAENAAPLDGHATDIGKDNVAIQSAEPNKTPNADPIEKKRRMKYRLKILFGLVAPFTLQSLDTTIIASALPFIAQDFDQVKQLNWIISAFNLTSAAFLPFWAQIADIFGRFATILITIVVILIGSAICTGTPTSNFPVLLLGRGIQGVGAAGVMICVRIILADRVSLADYSFNWTLFSLISAVAFSIGPVIGGYLTQASWRWCFAINLPVAIIAIILVLILLRNDLMGPQPLPEIEGRDASSRHGRFFLRLTTIDYGGQLLFLWGLGLLILALTWGGGSYPWDSVNVLAPLVIGTVLTIIWVTYEFAMAPGRVMARVFPFQRAMIPWELLAQRDVCILFFTSFASGMAMYAVLYFMDLYFALVKGNTASEGGKALLFFLPGLGVGAYMAMFLMNIWPRQTTPAILLGSTTSAVGITVLSWAVNGGKDSIIYGMMALTGHGIGMRMVPATLHCLAFFPAQTSSITFIGSFAMPFGGTVSLTLMSTVFNNKSGRQHADAQAGIHWAFIALIPFMWIVVVLATFLGNVWILSDGHHDVVNGAWLWSLVTRRKLVKERRSRAADGMGVAENGSVSADKVDEEKQPEAEAA